MACSIRYVLFMSRFIVTAFGPDNYGIVARVTSALAELNCNLADSTMSNLSGHFAMMLVVDGEVDEKSIFNSVQSKCAELNLVVDVKQIDPAASPALDGDRYVLSVYGTDRPGIVAGICEVLAAHNANIFDLTTRVTESDLLQIYTMIMEIALAEGEDPQLLEMALRAKAELLGVSCSLRAVDSEEL